MAEYIMAFLFLPGTISLIDCPSSFASKPFRPLNFFPICVIEKLIGKKDDICHEQDVEGPLLTATSTCLVDGKPTSFKGLIHILLGF